jgi:rhodanese-related sulfurtransferase
VNEQKIKMSADQLLAERMVQIHPGELLKTMADDRLIAIIIDVRPEADYNLFHIKGSRNIPLADLESAMPSLVADQAANKIYVMVSNDETAATQAWKLLVANSVTNAYLLEGGINNWITVFGKNEDGITPLASKMNDTLSYLFPAALGDRYDCASPSPLAEWEIEFTPKIQLQLKRDKSSGGCG